MKQIHSIYSDGNYFPRAKKSGFGGYIEAPDGQVLVEYTEQIRQPQYAYSFELLGIIRGLQLAQAMGLKNIVSYCDDKTTMSKLKEVIELGGDTSHLTQNSKPELYDQIIELSKQFESSEFHYIPRAQNKHSDSLSRRYAGLMEQNFIKQYQEELDVSEKVFNTESKINKRLFFSHPSLVRMKEKNNPFLVANYRNKKARKISRAEQQLNYQHLFIEILRETEDEFILKGFFYHTQDKKELILTEKISNQTELSSYCQFLTQCLNNISQNTTKLPLWIYSNLMEINQFFEQKEKFQKDNYGDFRDVNKALNNFDRVLYHALPFKHEFSPEIALIEAKKSELDENLESVESLMEQLKQGTLGREQNKYFGKLIRYQLRNYQEYLKRDLNEIEKFKIIEKTTNELEKNGLLNLPKLKR